MLRKETTFLDLHSLIYRTEFSLCYPHRITSHPKKKSLYPPNMQDCMVKNNVEHQVFSQRLSNCKKKCKKIYNHKHLYKHYILPKHKTVN